MCHFINTGAMTSIARKFIRGDVFQLNFYRLHLIYFIIWIIIGSIFIYLLPNAGYNISYINALSLSSSAMTTTGLNPVNLGDLSTGQQVMLVILMLVGNQVFTSMSTIWIRRYYFRRHFQEIVNRADRKRETVRDAEADRSEDRDKGDQAQLESNSSRDRQGAGTTTHRNSASIVHSNRDESEQAEQKDQASTEVDNASQKPLVDHTLSHHKGLGSFPNPFELRSVQTIINWFNASSHKTESEAHLNHEYLSFTPNIIRNSHFHGLTTSQEEELGGVEYGALELLTWILPIYFLGWIFLGIIILAPWATYTSISTFIKADQPGDLNAAWFASFLAVSAFVNCGFDLLNSSFSSLTGTYLVVLVTVVLLTAGNTFYPVFLRLFIWLIHICSPRSSRTKITSRFLLDHPRRTFIYLFPSAETWNLFTINLLMQLFAWGMYVLLNAHNSETETPYPIGQYVLAGFFQAVAIRHGGFYIVTLSELAAGVLVIYLGYMYISNYPILLTVRHSNVYEDHALGISKDDAEHVGLKQHIEGQLFYDMWWIALTYFLLAVIESAHFITLGSSGFSLFAVLFELLSAYGNVGASLSLTGQYFSLSGNFRILSKLVLIAVMIRGRHRGLPSAIDRSIMLPGEQNMKNLDRGRRHDM